MEFARIVIHKDKAYTFDIEGNLRRQEVGDYNQFYYSSDPHSGGNLYDDWEVVDDTKTELHQIILKTHFAIPHR